MIRLVIETATAACSAALLDGDCGVAERHELVGRGHAERLVPMIAELLSAGRRPDAILVDCGPGSFTGVRVGLAAARGLAIGWGVPVTGFSSLALIAAALFWRRPDAARLVVAIPGGHGELFVQAFARDLSAGPLRSLPPAEAAAALDETLVAGAAAAEVVAVRGWGEAVDALPRASDARLLPALLAGLPPTPIYGREPDAMRRP